MLEFKDSDVIKNELFINGILDSVSVHMRLSLMMMKSVLPDCKTPIALAVGAAQEIPESNIPPKIVGILRGYWLFAARFITVSCFSDAKA